ncbi:MAG: cytochrome c-type biogenesis CcmF C-terminal domain-containing protein, partial [Xanthobacteraceae bacterium]
LAPFGIGLALFVIGGAVTDIIERSGIVQQPMRIALTRAAGLPRSVWGGALAHAGIGITLLGIVCETNWAAERIATVRPRETVSLGRYDLAFEGVTPRQGPNYSELVGNFTVYSGGAVVGRLQPSKRSFAARGNETSEAALLTRGFSQLYLSLGEARPDGAVVVRLYHKPLVLLIWLGTVVMFLGGALSLSDRRLRVGAPRPAKDKTQALMPAE